MKEINSHHLIVGYLKTSNIADYELLLIEKILVELTAKFNEKENDNKNLEIQAIEFEKLNADITKINCLLCFNDSDLLSFIQKSDDFPKSFLVVELPGDNSFFALTRLDDLKIDLSTLIISNFQEIDERSLLNINLGNKRYLALNDVHITSSTINARLRYDVMVENSSIFDGEADSANAILISTPTGSTAMSLNVGGAIIQPHAKVFQLQAIASRNLLSNHYITPDNLPILIDIIEAKFPLVLNIDNLQISSHTSRITITKSESKIRFSMLNKSKDESNNKLSNKISFEDTHTLTSSAKFILHVLQNENKSFTINEISEITHITNQKTVRNAIKLLMTKGLIKRKENLNDLREYLYYSI